MNNTPQTTNSMLKRLLLLLGIVSTAILIVVACGGGSSRQTAEPVALPPTQTEQPLAAASVQADGGVRMENINGFSVPPEPDAKLNKSTLAGVDVNANGVRDDVERAIATKVSNVAEFENALQIAVIYQRVLVSGLSSQADANAFMISVSCAGIRTTERLRRSAVQALILNTSERTNAFRANTTRFDGPIINPAKDCH